MSSILFKNLNRYLTGYKIRLLRRLKCSNLDYRFASLVSGYSFLPEEIVLLVTGQCNLSCRMCNTGFQAEKKSWAEDYPSNKELNFLQWKVIIDKLSGFNNILVISGGEPLLHRDIIPILTYIAKKSNIDCCLITNGFYLEKFAQEILDTQINSVSISIDGPNADIHDKIRGREGAFAKAITGLEKLLKLKEKTKSSLPRVSINFTINSINFHLLKEAINFFKNFKLDSFSISQLTFFTEDMLNLHNNQLSSSIEVVRSGFGGMEADEWYKQIDPSVLFEQMLWVKNESLPWPVFVSPILYDLKEIEIYYKKPKSFLTGCQQCFTPWRMMEILPDGNVTFSNNCFKYILGNLYRQAFREVWQGLKYRELRLKMKEQKAYPICPRCCYIRNKRQWVSIKKLRP